MVAFDNAIKAALDKVNLDETLVIVTADHSHGDHRGYPKRGNPILDTIVEPTASPSSARTASPSRPSAMRTDPGR